MNNSDDEEILTGKEIVTGFVGSGCGCGILLLVGALVLAGLAGELFTTSEGLEEIINVIKMIGIGSILVSIFIFIIYLLVEGHQNKKKEKNLEVYLKTYQNNNQNASYFELINSDNIMQRVVLDRDNKKILLFANDNEGYIIEIPFSDLRSYEIDDNQKLTIKTDIDDPHLSYTWLYLDNENLPHSANITNVKRDLEYVFGRQNKDNI